MSSDRLKFSQFGWLGENRFYYHSFQKCNLILKVTCAFLSSHSFTWISIRQLALAYHRNGLKLLSRKVPLSISHASWKNGSYVTMLIHSKEWQSFGWRILRVVNKITKTKWWRKSFWRGFCFVSVPWVGYDDRQRELNHCQHVSTNFKLTSLNWSVI